MFSIWFMYNSRHYLIQTSWDMLFIEEFPSGILPAWDIGCHLAPFIPVTNLFNIAEWLKPHAICSYTQQDWFWVNCTSWLLLIACDFKRTIYNPEDYPLVLIIVFHFFYTTPHYGSSNTIIWYEQIQIEPTDGDFIHCVPYWDTVTT